METTFILPMGIAYDVSTQSGVIRREKLRWWYEVNRRISLDRAVCSEALAFTAATGAALGGHDDVRGTTCQKIPYVRHRQLQTRFKRLRRDTGRMRREHHVG